MGCRGMGTVRGLQTGIAGGTRRPVCGAYLWLNRPLSLLRVDMEIEYARIMNAAQ